MAQRLGRRKTCSDTDFRRSWVFDLAAGCAILLQRRCTTWIAAGSGRRGNLNRGEGR